MKEYNQMYRHKHRAYLLEHKRALNRNLKEQVIIGYGGSCVCCGEMTYEFLTIDHKNNDGNKERKIRGHSVRGYGFYLWLIKQGFPDSYQLLCFNCNAAKAFFGRCPHAR